MWRWGWSPWETLARPRRSRGLALSVVAAGILGRMVTRAGRLEELLWRVVASFTAGVVGLGVALH